jgi:tRNA G18 (ribose-2'-O)-methylase SpoU
MIKLGAKELRKSSALPEAKAGIHKNPIYFVLDNVLDTYNIGSMFRLADALAIEKIYLCGNMDFPPSSRIHKAAVGTEEWVSWEKRDSTLEVVNELKNNNIYIIAVEQDPRSIPLSKLSEYLKLPVAIVVGHESEGVAKEVLDEVDAIVELPMFGVNKSFNVWGTAAVVGYKIVENLK